MSAINRDAGSEADFQAAQQSGGIPSPRRRTILSLDGEGVASHAQEMLQFSKLPSRPSVGVFAEGVPIQPNGATVRTMQAGSSLYVRIAIEVEGWESVGAQG